MITLTDSTLAALRRIATAPATSDQYRARETTTQLPDGAIRCCVGSRCATVGSWHLVAGKLAQLRRSQNLSTTETL
jgi:hypothetical protein